MSRDENLPETVRRAIQEQHRRIERGEDSSDRAIDEPGWHETVQRWADLDAKDQRDRELHDWDLWLEKVRNAGITVDEASNEQLWGYYIGSFDPRLPFVQKLKDLESSRASD